MSQAFADRRHAAAHLAELELAGPAAQDDLVAVLEEAAFRAVRQAQRPGAVLGELDQRALGAGLGARDRSRWPSGRRCGGGRRSTSRARAAAASSSRASARSRARRPSPFSSTSRSMSSAQSRPPARCGSARRLLRGRLDAVLLEQRERRHPGGDRRLERLAEERAERDVLPRLDVARAPVVHEHDAEDVVGEALRRDRLAASVGTPTTKPSSSSMSSRRVGAYSGASEPGASSCAARPDGRRCR